jgi:hypothetical protein
MKILIERRSRADVNIICQKKKEKKKHTTTRRIK